VAVAESSTPWGCIASVAGALITAVVSIVVVVVQHQDPHPVNPPKPPPPVEAVKVSGSWQGFLVQMMPNGSQTTYTIELQLSQDGHTLTGQSRQIIANTNYYAVIGLNGHVGQDRSVTLHDLVFHQGYPNQGWCTKTASLELSADDNTLDGTWQAPGCSGGTMKLQRR
jgi:hypothetical protein